MYWAAFGGDVSRVSIGQGVKDCGRAHDGGSRPYVLDAVARDEHHVGWRERFTEPVPLPDTATAAECMAYRLKTKAGRSAYALRKQTVEPVSGIIKSVLGFRQFLLRGVGQDRVRMAPGVSGLESEAHGHIVLSDLKAASDRDLKTGSL